MTTDWSIGFHKFQIDPKTGGCRVCKYPRTHHIHESSTRQEVQNEMSNRDYTDRRKWRK